MAQTLVFREHDFPPDLECQVVSFVRVQWPSVFTPETRLDRHMWRGWNATHVVVEEAGVVISYAAVIETAVRQAGETYRALGVSSVFTYPSFRGEGHGRRVVDAATDHARASDIDVAVLWCELGLEGFYGKSGWAATRSPTLVGTPENQRVEDDSDNPVTRMMVFVSEKGRAARPSLEREPLFVGAHTW